MFYVKDSIYPDREAATKKKDPEKDNFFVKPKRPRKAVQPGKD